MLIQIRIVKLNLYCGHIQSTLILSTKYTSVWVESLTTEKAVKHENS